MRIAVIGGGPGGLYFSALTKQLSPGHDITVWERNAADDTFGFGVVFSDETLGGIEHADPEVYAQMQHEFARWDDIDIHFRGQVLTSGGHGFAAMSRKRLLQILQARCLEVGVDVRFSTAAPDVAELERQYDLVVACDGVNSAVRTRYADTFVPSLDARHCRYMWLGTDRVFDAFKFIIQETPHGVMQIHGYPFDAHSSTFIVEMNDDVWRRAGFDEFADREFAPGESDEKSVELVRSLFAEALDGHEVLTNNSKWLRFTTVRTQRWRRGNVVLLGDAAHTAHFSIGSGTKLAMEDALALAACLHEQTEVAPALAAYETERQAVVVSTQRAAQASLEWFENIAQYVEQDPLQFGFNIMTRSRRVTYDNLRLRDPEFVGAVDELFGTTSAPPMFQPFQLRELELVNRVVVPSLGPQGTADAQLIHLGGKAMGGAGLVLTELVAVSAEARVTSAWTGLYDDEQVADWQRITEFVHAESAARIGIQLGHAGPRAEQAVVPHALSIAALAGIRDDFVAATRRAEAAGFDLVELQGAHGFLLSAFLSPLTNQRDDEFGGTLTNRLRYPLEVFAAMRAEWPEHKPMAVRISATDWYEGGTTAEDAVQIARAFATAGADLIDVSTGEVVAGEKPAYGRSYQTPFADKIRNEVGVATMAVGAISSYDDVNSILLAGRADLCAVGRGHLNDPSWVLHAAAEQDYTGPGAVWPAAWRAGSGRPPTGRTDGPRPRLELIQADQTGTRHRRWRP